jgi:hypothetical protein
MNSLIFTLTGDRQQDSKEAINEDYIDKEIMKRIGE